MMSDITVGLDSFSFESGLSESETAFLYLKARYNALMLCACAHAAFFVKLNHAVRLRVLKGLGSLRSKVSCLHLSADGGILKVGVLGGGRIGKQLTKVLLQFTNLHPGNLKVSSRRPETLDDLKILGVECFYDNRHLAAWADVLFLCCLPSHLSRVCAEIQPELSQSCIVYSFVSAVPVPRLKQLLGHSSILRPEYTIIEGGSGNVWEQVSDVIASLKDPLVVEATCPLRQTGGISVDRKWFAAVLYSVLNVCSHMNVDSQQSLNIINELLIKQSPAQNKSEGTFLFTTQNFVNATFASTLSEDDPFPWISLTDVLLKDTPLSKILSEDHSFREHLAATYCAAHRVPSTESEETKEQETSLQLTA
ncbi:NADP-dependent oxidoreductase domain-containing protein 1 [Polyodon spathula]|uniref:NADP-dependent oxidoreductase domain-containing protein 1 n=1 Tax=Polyodon spathula TaxID=7913 RepID=UPI001B7F2912|nr:NADP-dependent oxidoreductase domain-containing protein 1 [Polyodon spathula]